MFELLLTLVVLVTIGPLYGVIKVSEIITRYLTGYKKSDIRDKESFKQGKNTEIKFIGISILLTAVILLGTYLIISTMLGKFQTSEIKIFHSSVFAQIVNIIVSILLIMIGFRNIGRASFNYHLVGTPTYTSLQKNWMARKLIHPGYIAFPIFLLLLIGLSWFLPYLSIFNEPNSPSAILLATTFSFILASVLAQLIFPPFLLLLSTSTENNMAFQRMIGKTDIYPVVSLLSHESPAARKTDIGSFDVFRTENQSRWTESVRILMDICPVIVMDTRHITEPVLTEADMIFSNEIQRKTLFVVQEDRSHPVLDTFFSGHPSAQVDYWRFTIQKHLFTENELIELLNDRPRLKSLVQTETVDNQNAS